MFLRRNERKFGAGILCGVLQSHLGNLRRHGCGVATVDLCDHLYRLLQSGRAFLQGHEKLLLALLVREQLLVVADAHAHQALAQLITVGAWIYKNEKEKEGLEFEIIQDRRCYRRMNRREVLYLHERTGGICGILNHVVDVLHGLRLGFNLHMSALVDVEVFLQLESLAAVGVVADPLLFLGMGLLVSFQRTLLHKFLGAKVALERSLAGVRTCVTGEGPP